MFFQIVNTLGDACQAVYGWFWDFIHDGYGNIALTVVIGMVIFSIVYRFFILPVMGMSIPSIMRPTYSLGNIGSGSDGVDRSVKAHPDFSQRQAVSSRQNNTYTGKERQR